ncbi:hypothetical protein [Actinocorallia longicatena]|uniref:Uncharacterized protein n=1 Tax=Actinocorallia longicatena TaxID=111803 RepID=A0ABP6QES1_9ACTN
MVRIMSVAGAIVVAMAGTAAMGSAASAAPKAKCWVGSWKVTTATVYVKDTKKAAEFTVKGGAGIKVKLAKTGKMSYDFTGSKPLKGTGTVSGVPTSASVTLTRKLTASSKITGSTKGKITAKVSSVKGNALLKLTSPFTTTLNIAKAAKKGAELGLLPIKATYTCSGRTGTIQQKYTKGATTTKSTWKLRRS